MATIARRRRAMHPITHYWGLVKDFKNIKGIKIENWIDDGAV